MSTFSPTVAPSQVPWGQKVFTADLGEDRSDDLIASLLADHVAWHAQALKG